jgi:broad specificity phosphatase PhoE
MSNHRRIVWVVAVSHADVIKLLVAHYVGVPIDLFQRITVSPGSLSRLVLPKRGVPRLLACNDVGHLVGE